MQISELFYSIQGEGKRTGKPSFFIRTNFCNLRCKFPDGNLCDTYYTSWFPDDENNIGEMNIDEIVNRYKEVMCGDVVISGGEPTMYADELEPLCKKLRESNNDVIITIETNGTYFGNFADHADLISISPKLNSSTPFKTDYEKMHSKNRLNIETFRKYNELKSKDIIDIQWKFIFTGEGDIDEIKELQKLVGFENKDIYLMPEGVTKEELDAKRKSVIEACIDNGYNYTDRIHILVWGNKRGV